MTVRDVITNFGANTSSLEEGVNNVKAKLSEVNRSFFDNKRAMNDVNKQLKELANEQKAYENSTGSKTEKQAAAYQENARKIDELRVKQAALRTEEMDLRIQINETTAALRDQSGTVQKTASDFSGVATALKAVAFGLVGQKLKEFLVDGNAEMEQYQSSFITLLKSEQEAGVLMNELADFASKTPLKLENAAQGAKNLLAVGVASENVRGKLQTLGDLAMGDAGKMQTLTEAYSKMLTAQKVDLEQLNRFTEAGIPIIQELSKVYKISTQELYKMVSDGKIGLAELEQAMANLTTGSGQFSGAMEAQSQTMSGLLSTMQDNFAALGRQTGQGVFNVLKGDIKDVIATMQQMEQDGSIDRFASDAGKTLSVVGNVFSFAVRVGWEFRDVLVGVGTGFVALKTATAAVGMLNTVVTTFKKLGDTIKATGSAMKGLQAAFNANPYILVAAALAGVTMAVINHARESDIAGKAIDRYNQSMENARLQGEQIISTSDGEIAQIELKTEVYEELRTKVNKTSEEQAALKQVALELQAVLPNGTTLIDQQSGAYFALGTQIDIVIQKMRAQAALNADKAQYEAAVAGVKDLENAYNQAKEKSKATIIYDTSKPEYKDFKHNPTTLKNEHFLDQSNKIKKEMDEAQKVIDEYEKKYRDFLKIGTEKSNSSLDEDKKFASTEDPLKVSDSFKQEQSKLKLLYQYGEMSEKEYYSRSEGLLKKYNADRMSDYSSYFLEIQNGRKSMEEKENKSYQLSSRSVANYAKSATNTAEKEQKEQERLIEEKQKTIDDAFDKQAETLERKHNLDEISETEYYNQLEILLENHTANSLTRYDDYYYKILQGRKKLNDDIQREVEKAAEKELDLWIKSEQKKVDILYDSRRKTLEKSQKRETDSIDSGLNDKENEVSSALSQLDKDRQNALNSVIDYTSKIEEQEASEKKRVQSTLDGIEQEIQARRKLNESADQQKEIDFINARLKYEQLEDFDRYELEKQLEKFNKEKAEKNFTEQAEARKNAAQAEMSAIEEKFAEQKRQAAALAEASRNAINSSFDTQREALQKSLEEYRASTELQKEQMENRYNAAYQAMDAEKEKVLEVYAYIGENFTSLDELHRLGITNLNEAMTVAIQNNNISTEKQFSLIDTKVKNTADNFVTVVGAGVDKAFNYGVSKADAAIQNLLKAIDNANTVADQAIDRVQQAAAEAESRISYANNNYNNNNNVQVYAANGMSTEQVANAVMNRLSN